jgi:peptidoglycan-N-acetylglucosamine deacetylase
MTVNATLLCLTNDLPTSRSAPQPTATMRPNSSRQPGFALAVLSLCLVVGLSEKATAGAACTPDELGVGRTLVLSTKGGFAVGLKSYPRTLDLADHEVVLTFDDGPSPKTTPAVLAALEHQCVRAAFFLIGRNAAANVALVRREIGDGDTIGNHTYSHPILRLLTNAAARADIDRGFAADENAAGQPTSFFRFPGFADTPALIAWLESRNIGIFGADLWMSDWLKMTPDEERKLALERLEKARRGILLLHDTKLSTAEMLPGLLADLKTHGFKIVDIVPGDAKPAFSKAPPGWTSETEAILAKVLKARGKKQSNPASAHLPESVE